MKNTEFEKQLENLKSPLAITRFYWDKVKKELLITIKYRLANIILLVISIGIVAVFLLYIIVENIHHQL